MDFDRRITQLLHEDHSNTLELINMLEDMIIRTRRSIPDIGDPAVRQVLEKTAQMIAHETRHHFTFEENELFTRLEAAGDVGIGTHLREEHQAILPLGEKAEVGAKDALASGFTAQSWPEFRSLAAEITERMLAHIQKEEMALLPLLDDLIDAETDMALSEAFTETQ